MRLRGRRGLARLARGLGLGGLVLAVLFTALLWTLTLGFQGTARATLTQADANLAALDTQLAGAQSALAPLDVLARPEALAAVRALHRLAEDARAAPLLQQLVSPRTLADAATLTGGWERALAERPPLSALAGARAGVQTWRDRVRVMQRRLTLTVWTVNLVTLLLGGWFAAGQVALVRAAERRLGKEE